MNPHPEQEPQPIFGRLNEVVSFHEMQLNAYIKDISRYGIIDYIKGSDPRRHDIFNDSDWIVATMCGMENFTPNRRLTAKHGIDFAYAVLDGLSGYETDASLDEFWTAHEGVDINIVGQAIRMNKMQYAHDNPAIQRVTEGYAAGLYNVLDSKELFLAGAYLTFRQFEIDQAMDDILPSLHDTPILSPEQFRD
jgi:hypothetical protein